MKKTAQCAVLKVITGFYDVTLRNLNGPLLVHFPILKARLGCTALQYKVNPHFVFVDVCVVSISSPPPPKVEEKPH